MEKKGGERFLGITFQELTYIRRANVGFPWLSKLEILPELAGDRKVRVNSSCYYLIVFWPSLIVQVLVSPATVMSVGGITEVSDFFNHLTEK